MVWRAEDPQGFESAKIRYDVIPYMRGNGLDIGCGNAKIFPHCVGVDQFPQQGVDIVRPATDLRIFASGTMDFVFSSHTLEDIEDTAGTLREWWRLLAIGGYLVLYLPHKNFYPNIGQPGANPAHKHDFLPADIVKVMEEVAPDWDIKLNQERNADREYSFLQVYRKLPEGAGHFYSADHEPPSKTAVIVRPGAYGDSLWASSICAHLKEQGYHVTVYTEAMGEEVLRCDPNIDRIVVNEPYFMPPGEWLKYWTWLSFQKADKFINLVQCVESRLLPQPGDIQFYLPDDLRAEEMNKCYIEEYHRWARLPLGDYRVRFYPTKAEREWATEERAKYPGFLVVINPTGSTFPKHWPYVQGLMDLLTERGIYHAVLGDLRELKLEPSIFGRVIGREWDIRKALAFCQLSDVVIGEESVMVNAVAYEPMLKIVLLSHSSHENLTKTWHNTVATDPHNLACYPCHRIHRDNFFCAVDKNTGAAACQAVVSPAQLISVIDEYQKILSEEAA